MPDATARLDLPLLQPAQAQKHVTHNEALLRLDLLVQLAVEDFDANDPPALPLEGQVWALGPAPVAAWAGEAGRLAAWVGGAWLFVDPGEGWQARHRTTGELRWRQGGAWASPPPPDMANLPVVGVNTTADATNRLAVAAEASLLTHAGAGHQLKVNKAGSAETASLLFQSAWSGRAEMGLAGEDDFSLKVSPDGTTWHSALGADRATGRLSAPAGMVVGGEITGSAVTQSADDTTAGRILRVGDFGLGGAAVALGAGHDLDTVLHGGLYAWSASDVPAGAPGAFFASMIHIRRSSSLHSQIVFRIGTMPVQGETYIRARSGAGWSAWKRLDPESGSNANGNYLRLADGTQICTNDNAPITTDPAAFVGTVTSIDGDRLRIGRWY